MAESSDACEPVVVRRSPEISATAKFIKSGETVKWAGKQLQHLSSIEVEPASKDKNTLPFCKY